MPQGVVLQGLVSLAFVPPGRLAGAAALVATLALAGCATDRGPAPGPDSTAAPVPASPTGQPETASPPDPYVAQGNEPFWRLEVAQESMTLIEPGDPDLRRTRAERIGRTATPVGGTRVSGVVGAGPLAGTPLEARIARDLCRDTMTGMPYPDRVRVRIGRRTLEGCGGQPIDLLRGTPWRVTALDGEAVADGEGAPRGTLDFRAAGTIAGEAFCNGYRAAFEIGGEGLRAGRAVTTRRACPPPAMALETRFLEILTGVRRFDLSDDRRTLTLYADGSAGAGVRTLTAVRTAGSP